MLTFTGLVDSNQNSGENVAVFLSDFMMKFAISSKIAYAEIMGVFQMDNLAINY